MKRQPIFGVGINDADYVTEKRKRINGKKILLWVCPYYSTWRNMIKRCYSEKSQIKSPTYKGCSVCDEWLIFSNFKSWMETQDWQDKQLDKDLLKVGNRVYCPEYCIFVDRIINSFVLGRSRFRGEFLIGVTRCSRTVKYVSKCNNPETTIAEFLGRFDTELEAHLAWKRKKHEHACMLAERCDDHRLAEALRNRYRDVDTPMISV